MKQVVEKKIIRVKMGKQLSCEDIIAIEAPLTIFLNGKQFVTLLCTPEELDSLSVGFLRSEGIINEITDIVSLRIEAKEGYAFVETAEKIGALEQLYGKRTITSGCGKGSIFFNVLDSLKSRPVESSLCLSFTQVSELMHLFQEKSALFRETGGNHSAAICTSDNIVVFCEDIARHNAVDKVIGRCLREKASIEDTILVTSGRLSSEILLKTAKMRIPILISRAAPTSLSIELAEHMGVTMIGFARGIRFNVYTHPRRIKKDS